MAKVVVVDLDNTLILPHRDLSYLNDEVVDVLHEMGIVDVDKMNVLISLRDGYMHDLNRVEYQQQLINFFQHYIIPGIAEDELIKAYGMLELKNYRLIKPVFDAIVSLQSQGYVVIIVTAVLQQFQYALADIIPFDYYLGIEFELDNNRLFTNKVIVNPNKDKLSAVEAIINECGYTWNGSVAFGDSMSDFGYLSKADKPFVINPQPELLFQAMKNSWPIVVHDINDYYLIQSSNRSANLTFSVINGKTIL